MKNGWEVEALTAEVGARGAISSSLDGLARALGGCKENSAIKKELQKRSTKFQLRYLAEAT